jgi:hypothetical protein
MRQQLVAKTPATRRRQDADLALFTGWPMLWLM